MHELIKNLYDVIDPVLHSNYSSKEIVIKESDPNACCKQLILKYTSRNIFAFSLDSKKITRIFPFFRQSCGDISKVNDCIIFYKKGDNIFVFLVELKSNHLGDYKNQLKAGKIFTNYLKDMLNFVFQKQYKIDENNIKCLIVSTKKSTEKRTTKRKNIPSKKVNQLNIVQLHCNSTYQLESFIET